MTFLNGLSFAAPLAGGLALLGIPAVIAIHFLQRPSRPLPVSTLFLLERIEPQSIGGSRWDRLRQSWPFWLQLFAVLLIAWILSQPRWFRPDSAQTVLVVLDSSVSMRAFETTLRTELPKRLRFLSQAAGKTEWLMLETDPTAERLYAGGRLEELEAALAKWRPKLGTHDPQPVLRLGQTLVRDRGIAIFVTDRKSPLPPGIELFAIGAPIENAGFSGVRANAEGWEALLTNYGARPQTRSWWLEDRNGQRSAEAAVTLSPGQTETVRGRFPEGSDAIRVVLSRGDAFELDDSLPLVRPAPKRLRVAAPSGVEWLDLFLRDDPALVPERDIPDFRFIAYDPLAPGLPDGPAIAWVANPTPATKMLEGTVIAERDPLMAGLSWEGLLAADSLRIPAKPDDRVLLWQGSRPMILVRGNQLLFGFDPAQSNAPRLPAFVLLMHRFVEAARAALPSQESANFETNQAIAVAHRGGPLRLRVLSPEPGEIEAATALRVPTEPGFFEVIDRETTRLHGAAHFADPREADFREAIAVDNLDQLARSQRERQSRPDGLTPLWLLMLGAVVVASWSMGERRRKG